MSRNTVEIQDGRTVKKFSSHLNFVTETAIYEKLKGTGLAPELIYSGQDYIEHSFVPGPSLFQLLVNAQMDGRSETVELLFDRFFGWYRQFNEVTGQTLGNIDLHKIIVTGLPEDPIEKMDYSAAEISEAKLVGIDFEHCRVGHVEGDVAKLVSQIYLVPKPFSEEAQDVCVMFVNCAKKQFGLNPVTLEDQIKKELSRVCKLLKIFYDSKEADALCKRLNA